jgi:phosphoglucosamine mutase
MTERLQLGGTDGFRGLAVEETGPGLINEETFRHLTYALVAGQLEKGELAPVVVAQDTRPSSKRLGKAVMEGALAYPGVEVWNLGVAPTPAAQKVSQEYGGMATVVITASHNEYPENGWKGMLRSSKPSKDEVRSLSQRYWRQVDQGLVIPVSDRVVPERPELTRWYIDKVVSSIECEFGERPLDGKLFVIDGANGAAQKVTPEVFTRLGAAIETFGCGNQGQINEDCGAASLGGLKKFLTQNPNILTDPRFVGAVANDGDADRMMGIGLAAGPNDHRQLVEIDGNHVMAALAEGQPGIVGTQYTNTALVRKLQEEGIGFEYCANGDVFVTQKLRELQASGKDWRRGGEFTGHHVVLDWLSSGDGVRMAAWFAAYAVQKNQTFGDIHQNMPLWAEKMTKVTLSRAKQSAIQGDEVVERAIRQAEEQLEANGRIIVRPSGTEPVVRIWGESPDAQKIGHIVSSLAKVVQSRAT